MIATAVGMVLGGALGGVGLTLLMEQINVPSLVWGIGAAAVLGGIWAFLAAGFCQVALGAAWQAVRQPDKSALTRDE